MTASIPFGLSQFSLALTNTLAWYPNAGKNEHVGQNEFTEHTPTSHDDGANSTVLESEFE